MTIPQPVSDMNICTHRSQTTGWLGASTVAVRESALASVTRISGGVRTCGRAAETTVLGENKERKEGEEQE